MPVHMLIYLTARADCITNWSQWTVASNKLLLLSDPFVRSDDVCACLCVHVDLNLSLCVLVWKTCFQLENEIRCRNFFPFPSKPFLLLLHLHLLEPGGVLLYAATLRQASAASILWTEVLSGYYLSADHIKTMAIKSYWAIRVWLLKKKRGSER